MRLHQKRHGYEQRTRRNKSFYSLDAGDGIEATAIVCYNDSPERVFDLIDVHYHLCCALNSLPETQGKYIDIQTLDSAIVHELIEKIVVHQAYKDDDGQRIQQIDIFYRFVGQV